MDGDLEALKLPVLVTQGAADKLVPARLPQAHADTIPGAKLSLY